MDQGTLDENFKYENRSGVYIDVSKSSRHRSTLREISRLHLGLDGNLCHNSGWRLGG